jgi:hypothetical protein
MNKTNDDVTSQTSKSAASPFTEDQIAEYYREGYTVARGLVPHEEIDRVLAEAVKIPPNANGSWTPSCFDFAKPTHDATLHRLLAEPHVVGAVEQIFQAPARVYYGMLAIVPAKGGKGLAWHQDNMYDVVLGKALNVFIALCDITPDKAILWVAPKTHLTGVQESTEVDGHRSAVNPPNGMPLPTLKKGDAAIFDRNTLHHSKRNETSEHRYAYAAQYMETTARSAKTGRTDLTKPLATDLPRIWTAKA